MKTRKSVFILTVLIALLIFTGCGSVQVDLTGEKQNASDTEQTASPEAAPQMDDSVGDLVPDGVLVSQEDQESLSYFGVDGQLLSKIQTPGIGLVSPDYVIIAGPVTDGQPFPPVVYHGWQPEQALMVNNNGQVSTLRQTESFLSITSAPGLPAFAFSEVLLNEDNLPHSFLYSGTPENIETIGSFYDLVDVPNYLALMPVGIRTVGRQAQAVWYTKTGWGIGGADLIFPVTRGLYLFDLTNGDNLQYADNSKSYQGISPDLAYAGTIDLNPSGNRSMSVINLKTSEQVDFPLDPTSDRGAGFVVFSPDDRFAAWLEASGSMISDPYNFHPRVRIGDVQAGGLVAVLEDTTVAQLIDGGLVAFMQPVGWLDNQTLLIEVRSENWEKVSLLKYDLKSSGISAFVSGSFVTFGYK